MAESDSQIPAPSVSAPDFSIEEDWLANGKRLIAGVDEAGRGPLAGPVVAAAVILNPEKYPFGLNDSKKLRQAERERLFHEILQTSDVAWYSSPPDLIDRINIRMATLQAMEKAVFSLAVKADCVLIDGRDVPAGLAGIGKSFVKGDSRSISIAAASIVAKVIRDSMMKRADALYPDYGFAGHKGYGSKLHREKIAEIGPCPLHRKSFSPIKQMFGSAL